jgi:hypothetical protein
MNYELKDKIQITKEFLNDLEAKSWHEIEHIQSQIVNIEPSSKIVQLLKNLLTSYYIFVGGLENISSEELASESITKYTDNISEKEPVIVHAKKAKEEHKTELYSDDDIYEPLVTAGQIEQDSEPFEYFVDFDEPVGEPITDEDLYNN